MTVKLLLPELGSSDVSVKDAIISILVQGKPLSAKSIHREIIKTWGLNVSYQGVHKAINGLADSGVIYKSGSTYDLNKKWISKLKDFIYKIDDSYGSSLELNVPKEENEITRKHFNTQRAYPIELAKFFNKPEVNRSKKKRFALMIHMQWPLDFSFQDFKLLSFIGQSQNTSVICQSDLPFDKWVADQYRRAGMRVKTGVKMDLKEEVYISDDYIIQGRWTPETRKLYDEVYANISDLVDLFKQYVREKLSGSKVDMTVTITKNAALADLLRNQALSYFKEGKK
jgi:hypothetical protein